MALSPGTHLGPYEIHSLLGAGGMGEAYRARDVRLRRDVAIKVVPEELASNKDRLRRFEQEARATAAFAWISRRKRWGPSDLLLVEGLR
jgi:serine/threonine protein kinase